MKGRSTQVQLGTGLRIEEIKTRDVSKVHHRTCATPSLHERLDQWTDIYVDHDRRRHKDLWALDAVSLASYLGELNKRPAMWNLPLFSEGCQKSTGLSSTAGTRGCYQPGF